MGIRHAGLDDYWQLVVLQLADSGYWPDISLLPHELLPRVAHHIAAGVSQDT